MVETVAGRLRELIVHGGFQAGDRLASEAELVKQLQVSRPVLREAVNRLKAIGLLSVRHGSGTFVAERDWLSSCTKLVGSSMAIAPRELLQFLEFRRVVESYAARRAAAVAEPDQVAALEQLLEEALNGTPQGSSPAMQADFRFHCMLVEIGGNKLMRNVMELLQEFIMVSMMRAQPVVCVDPEGAGVHRAIMKAIQDHSPESAEQAVHAHMDLLAKRLAAATDNNKPSQGQRPVEIS